MKKHLKYFLFFLFFITVPQVKGFLEKSHRWDGTPGYRDSILHKIIRSAAKDTLGERDRKLRKRVRALLQKENPEIVNTINNQGEIPLFLARHYPLTTKLLLQTEFLLYFYIQTRLCIHNLPHKFVHRLPA